MENQLGMRFVKVPQGTFMMGASLDETGQRNDETPRHRVHITKPFWLSVFTVTQGDFEAAGCENHSKCRGPRQPVEMVSRSDVDDFRAQLRRIDGRCYDLPSEAQWEYACRAGSDAPYCFGDDADRLIDYAWFGDDPNACARPVGGKTPNAWGLHDMHGNVWEYCRGLWDENGYADREQSDPIGTSGFTPVMRGGCFYSDAADIRSAKRFGYSVGNRLWSVGFRVITEVDESQPGLDGEMWENQNTARG